LMVEWVEYRLGEITDWFSGGTPAKSNEKYWNGHIPWISAKTLTDYRVSNSELNITEEALKAGSRLANIGDILLLVRGSGLFNEIPICLTSKPVAFNQDIKAIRAKDPHLQEFIFFWLYGNKKTLNDNLEETGIGAGKFDINLLKNFRISIPRNEKYLSKLVEFARALFDKIDLLHRQNKTLEAMAKTFFRKWFVEEAREDWEEKPLNQFLDFKEGPGIRNWQYTNHGVPFINIRLIANGEILVSKANFVSEEEGNGKYSHFHLQRKDMVVSTSGTLGKSAIIRDYHLPLLLNTSVIRFRPIDGINYAFMYQYLQSSAFYETLMTSASGSVQLNFGPVHLNQIIMTIPDNEQLARFRKVADPIYERIEFNYTQIRTLEKLRDTLLPKLMSGEVRVEYEN